MSGPVPPIDFVSAQPAQLGECPLWDGRTGHLYWIDIDGQVLHRLDPASGRQTTMATPGRPGSMALTGEPGRLLVAVEHELGHITWGHGRFEAWVALEQADTGNRLNDGRTDRTGRFWVGSMHTDAADDLRTGMLHRVEASGAHVTTRRGVGVSNGLAFSGDGQRMYYADTLEDTVWMYDYDLATGEARNEQVFTDFSELPGRPDGACVDAEGCFWVACVFGSAIARLTPDGTVDRVVEVPVAKPTMPAFGGSGLATLFVTSIGGGGTHDRDPAQPNAGHVLALDVGVVGIAEAPFAG
jgi:sugar lactone lactonase YvrE